jgi:hypothetical protein
MPHVNTTGGTSRGVTENPINVSPGDNLEVLRLEFQRISQIINQVVRLKETLDFTSKLLVILLERPNGLESDKLALKNAMINDVSQIVLLVRPARNCIGNNISISMRMILQQQHQKLASQSLLAQADLGEGCDYRRLNKNLVLYAKMLLEEMQFFRSLIKFKIEPARAGYLTLF